MPTLGAPLDFAKLEGRNFQAHQLGAAPSSPVKGQLYYNTADNTLYWYDGTTWQSAKGGSGAPTGPAGGDLSGTYPNPQIASGVIVDTDIAAANKDGAAAVPSLRTLGSGATQATAGNDPRLSDSRTPTAHKATHEPGGSDAMTVDAAAGVGSLRTLGLGSSTKGMPGDTPLNSIAVPTADISLNSKKIANLANPTLNSDAATKAYVDSVAQGLDAKQSVRAASTGNVSLLTGPQTIDGVACVTNDRILLKNQTAPAENGIYIVGVSTLGRANDADTWGELPSAYVFVEEGTTQADTGWTCTADAGGTLGTTAVPWAQFSGAGTILGGAGLTKTGNSIDVGAGPGITVNADTIQVANDGITNAMIADGAVNIATADVTGTLPLAKGGTGATALPASRRNLSAAGVYSSATHAAGTTWTITAATHGIGYGGGPNFMEVQCTVEATGAVIIPDIVINPSTGDVTITFAASQAANSIRTTIVGL